jgi:hypothetical protein
VIVSRHHILAAKCLIDTAEPVIRQALLTHFIEIKSPRSKSIDQKRALTFSMLFLDVFDISDQIGLLLLRRWQSEVKRASALAYSLLMEAI